MRAAQIRNLAAVGVVVTVVLAGPGAAAAPPAGPAWGAFQGGGQVGDWKVSGNMNWAEGRGTKGSVVATRRGASGQLTCHWPTVTNGNVTGRVATFDAAGSCDGPRGAAVAVSNHFRVVDNGEPGAGRDTITVSGGTVGFGGTITSGNLQVRGPAA